MNTDETRRPQTRSTARYQAPPAGGLYDPADEHDACGLAAVVSLTGERSHRMIELALEALANLEHRGAVGADAGTGDGAGLLCEIPHDLIRQQLGACAPELVLPPAGGYVAGLVFLPQRATER